MEYNSEEIKEGLRSIEAVRSLGRHLDWIPGEFYQADRSISLLYSQALAQSTGWEDWVEASRLPGFWEAMESASNCVVRAMTGQPAGKESVPDMTLTASLECLIALKPTDERLLEIFEKALPLAKSDPAILRRLMKIHSGKLKPKGKTSLRSTLGKEDDPSWQAVRGWTSHHYWLMTPAARLQTIAGLTTDQNKKLIARHGLVSHANPPILDVREGAERKEFQFRADWKGPRPCAERIKNMPPFIQC